jgi:hypothetical protein
MSTPDTSRSVKDELTVKTVIRYGFASLPGDTPGSGSLHPDPGGTWVQLAAVREALLAQITANRQRGFSYLRKEDVYELLGWPESVALPDSEPSE